MAFIGGSFKDLVNQFASANGWRVDELDDESAYLEFQGDSGEAQILEIFKAEGEDVLIFAAPMSAGYDSEEEVPHEFSTTLLQRNAELEVGYWCIEDIDGELVYSCVCEVPQDELDEAGFGDIVSALVRECDEVESLLEEMESGGEDE